MHIIGPSITGVLFLFSLTATSVLADNKALSSSGQHHHTAQTQHASALGQAAPLQAATRTIELTMDDSMRFSVPVIKIKRGETIRFLVRNHGHIKHEMVLGTLSEIKKHAELMARFPEMEHDDPNSVSVPPGEQGEFAWKFTRSGRFDFACLVAGHFEAGMKGKIVVSR